MLLHNIATGMVLEGGGVSGVKNRGLSLADPTSVNICPRGSATGAYINRSDIPPNVSICHMGIYQKIQQMRVPRQCQHKHIVKQKN